MKRSITILAGIMLALVVGLAYALDPAGGHGALQLPSAVEQLVLAGGAGVAFVGEVAPEIKAALEEFKTAVLGRIGPLEKKAELVDELDDALKKIELKMGRPNLSSGDGKNTAELKAFIGFLRNGDDDDLRREQKAMLAGADPQGGYLVPSEIDAAVTKYLRETSPMRQLARVVKVSTENFTMLHSVGGTSASWVGETSARPSTNTPEFQALTPPMGTLQANLPITQQLLDDAMFDLEAWLTEEVGEVFGEEEGDAFINGNGVSKPRGLFTVETTNEVDGTRANTKFGYVASGNSGALAASNPGDALITLSYAVKPKYRANASWLMSSEGAETVRKIKDSTGQYLWQRSLQEGQPDLLLGYPVFVDENVPAFAANSLSFAFGNFTRAYTIVDRNSMMLRDPYTNKPYVQFYTTRRVGGGVRDTRAVKFLKLAAS